MDEFELINRYFASGDVIKDVAVGIGDDGAVMSPEPGRQLVSVVDTMVEDVHFPAGTDAYDIGFRAVAVNLSDIAAMGARPRWMTLALTLPGTDEQWLDAFASGIKAAAEPYEVALVGGDTTSGAVCVVSVQITGDVADGAAITRSGAKPGDTVYVSGTLGDAAAGLVMIDSASENKTLTERFLRPTARVALGQALVGHANSAIDVSDGLLGDLDKLLAASEVGAVINLATIPVSAELAANFDEEQQIKFALTGGDDYELCFTAASLPDFLRNEVTAIGTIVEEGGLTCVRDGKVVTFEHDGYNHFRTST